MNFVNAECLVLQHDDSFEGFLTAVFDSYQSKKEVLITGSDFQTEFGVIVSDVITSREKANRVIDGVKRRFGSGGYQNVWIGFLSDRHDKSQIIYKYIKLGMRVGYAVLSALADDTILAMNDLVKKVGTEKMRTQEFLQFACIGENLYYAKIKPEHNVLPLVMPFFVDRFPTMQFVIHDLLRQVAGIFDTHEWVMSPADSANIPAISEDEYNMQKLWKRFYDCIAIEERASGRRRMGHMPKKYWSLMTEMRVLGDEMDFLLPSEASRLVVSKLAAAKSVEDNKNRAELGSGCEDKPLLG